MASCLSMEALRFRSCKDGAAIMGVVMALTLALSGALGPGSIDLAILIH